MNFGSNKMKEKGWKFEEFAAKDVPYNIPITEQTGTVRFSWFPSTSYLQQLKTRAFFNISIQQHTFLLHSCLKFNSGIFFLFFSDVWLFFGWLLTLTFFFDFFFWMFFKVFFFLDSKMQKNYNESNNQSSDYQMIRDSLSKRTFLVCYGSRNVVDTSLQQNSKENTRKWKKRTCFS